MLQILYFPQVVGCHMQLIIIFVLYYDKRNIFSDYFCFIPKPIRCDRSRPCNVQWFIHKFHTHYYSDLAVDKRHHVTCISKVCLYHEKFMFLNLFFSKVLFQLMMMRTQIGILSLYPIELCHGALQVATHVFLYFVFKILIKFWNEKDRWNIGTVLF